MTDKSQDKAENYETSHEEPASPHTSYEDVTINTELARQQCAIHAWILQEQRSRCHFYQQRILHAQHDWNGGILRRECSTA